MKFWKLLLIIITFTNCVTQESDGVLPKAAIHEILISEIQGKIITNGIISFLYYEGNQYKLIQFNCRLQKSRKRIYCRKLKEKIIDIDILSRAYPNWYTSSLFKVHIEKKVSSVSLYKCFSNDFLDLSNKKKLELLDSLSSNF